MKAIVQLTTQINRFGIVIFLTLSLAFQQKSADTSFQKIPIHWVTDLEGDFSFKEQWDYPEGVYHNSFGQLSCDGICPIEIESMKNSHGKIYEDSLPAFYQLVDTTHQFHSLSSETRQYEYFQCHLITFKELNGEVIGQSENNISTHSRLHLQLQGDSCRAWVDFNSIRDLGEHIFPLAEGSISIDQTLFEKGIVKATFDFKFENTLDVDQALFWKGKMYSKIVAD